MGFKKADTSLEGSVADTRERLARLEATCERCEKTLSLTIEKYVNEIIAKKNDKQLSIVQKRNDRWFSLCTALLSAAIGALVTFFLTFLFR